MLHSSEPTTHLGALRTQLRALGAGPRHEAHLLRSWAHALPVERPRRRMETFLPKPVQRAWPDVAHSLAGLARLQSRHPAADGSQRLLVGLHDGQTVEAVLLPRGGLCVSTQVGCAVGCRFCMTGRDGLRRQLGSAEIVAQVALARSLRAVTKVVFMGMGEPSHNLEAVLEAIELLGTVGGIGHKNLVFSTVGDLRAFSALQALTAPAAPAVLAAGGGDGARAAPSPGAQLRPGPVKPALALSLHTTRPSLRAELLPRAPRIEPCDLIQAADDYARASGYPAQVQWTLLDGINDGDDEVEAIAALMRGRHMMLNLILYNAVDGLSYRRPPLDRAVAMARALQHHGVLTRIRHSAGQDAEGGCGQLRARESVRPVSMPITGTRGAPRQGPL